MAYRFDNYDNSIVIDGFEKGIADNPFSGLADMRNLNIISVPGEASVNFATTLNSYTAIAQGTITGVSGNVITFSGAGTLESGMAIVFAGSPPTGITAGTTYWVGLISGTTFSVYSDFASTSLVTLSSTTTGATFTTPAIVGQPKYFTASSVAANGATFYWMVDANGRVWTNLFTTTSGAWVFTGNDIATANKGATNGNGLVFYRTTPGVGVAVKGYVFSFRNSFIDYIEVTAASPTWVYGWRPQDGTTGNTTATYTSGYLYTPTGTNNPHEAFCAPTNQVVFTDANWIGRFYEKTPGTTPFDPTSTGSYVFDQTQLLPGTDIAQCLTYLGTNYLVGGKNNVIYPWNGLATTFSYPILLAEYNVKKLVTVNTNTFIFVGNRGRIYYTNGTNANLYKKVPDHISGTVEPYFTWGGACSVKNQLYFSASATTNAGTAINQYGGVWAIDLDTQAIRLTNKLSYGTYAGYATALIPNFTSAPAGTGLYIGWDNGSSTYGIDTTSSSPYTGSQASFDSDLIPIGTFEKPRDFTKVEYRLTRPLVSGESVTIYTRKLFNTEDTGYSQTYTDSTVGAYSGLGDINLSNAQWIQFQVVLNSTASSPSYNRLKEIRIKGMVGPTLATSQQLSV